MVPGLFQSREWVDLPSDFYWCVALSVIDVFQSREWVDLPSDIIDLGFLVIDLNVSIPRMG